MSPATWGELALLLVCAVISALASATETALTSMGRLRLRHLVEEGSRRATVLQRLSQDPSRFLSTILVINTVALVLASFATTLLSVQLLPPRLGFWAELLVSLLLAVLLLVVAEVTPKTLAIRNAERIALFTAPVVDALANLLRPLLWLITALPRALTGGRAAHSPYLTEEELLTVLHVSEEQGVIEIEEREMIHGIIEIGDKSVREVMVPRTDITAVELSSGLEEVLRVFRERRHTRMPVYEGDLDHIVGAYNVKDFIDVLADGHPPDQLQALLRPVRFTPEQKKVDELLHQMQSEKVHMMIVVDEYGGTSGLVTLEDVIEEIVGEIHDEYDREEEPLQILDRDSAVVDARFPMEELNAKLHLGVDESSDYDSVGGYVLATLGEVPKAGAQFETGGVRWTVEGVEGRRVVKLRLDSSRPWPQEALAEAGLAPPRGPSPPGGAEEARH